MTIDLRSGGRAPALAAILLLAVAGAGCGAGGESGTESRRGAARSGADGRVAIDAGAPRDSVLARLGSLTDKCVACHASYRMVSTR